MYILDAPPCQVLGGGQAHQQKLEEPVTKITILKYVHNLTLKKKIVMLTMTELLRGVFKRPVKIFCVYFGHIYIFHEVLF